jgi:hypothetical protein
VEQGYRALGASTEAVPELLYTVTAVRRSFAEQNKDEAKFKKYVDEYVLGVKDYWEYLEKWGGLRRLQGLKADAYLGY